MVFCKECRRKVEDCPHFVPPIAAARMPVFDPKIETLAYDEAGRILEIAFKSGQTWQLFEVPAAIYQELRDTTISSFLRFIARRYKSAPVRIGMNTIPVPKAEPCANCKADMIARHRTGSTFSRLIRVLWNCRNCGRSEWKTYGVLSDRERRRSR